MPISSHITPYGAPPSVYPAIKAKRPSQSSYSSASCSRSFADHLIIQRGSFTVTLIVHCTTCTASELACRLYCVNVSTEEQKLPTVFFFLLLDHLLHFFAVVTAAGIFHSVRSDYKHCMLRDIFRSCVLMNISNVMNRTADGIQEFCASANRVP